MAAGLPTSFLQERSLSFVWFCRGGKGEWLPHCAFFLVLRVERLLVVVALWSGWTWMEMSLPPGWVSVLCFTKKGEKELIVLLWNLLLLLLSVLHHGARYRADECNSQSLNEAWSVSTWQVIWRCWARCSADSWQESGLGLHLFSLWYCSIFYHWSSVSFDFPYAHFPLSTRFKCGVFIDIFDTAFELISLYTPLSSVLPVCEFTVCVSACYQDYGVLWVFKDIV